MSVTNSGNIIEEQIQIIQSHVVNRNPMPNALASNAKPIGLCRFVGKLGANAGADSQADCLLSGRQITY